MLFAFVILMSLITDKLLHIEFHIFVQILKDT